MWLFRLPLFFTTVKVGSSAPAVSSFVVVLPALPVIATTRVVTARRIARASACSARSGSSTTITLPRAATLGVALRPLPRHHRACGARARRRPPRSRGRRTAGPASATNASPDPIARLSVTTSATGPVSAPRKSPPTACAIHGNVRATPLTRPSSAARAARPAPRAPWRCRRTAWLTPPISWYFSWPFAGDEDQIARRRLADRRADRLGAVHHGQHAGLASAESRARRRASPLR